MDPLSIMASTAALMQAAGAVAIALGSVVRSLRTVDSRLTALDKEVTDLTGFLKAIDGTLKGCQKFDFGLDDDALWRQSELALANCQTTLNELALLVGKIRDSNQPKKFARKVRAAVDLSIYGDDLVMYRDRIHQSNSALQTMLHAINVSLSVRSNASQDLILRELKKLEDSVHEALHISSRPVGGFHNSRKRPSDARLERNLRQFAEAAKHFHTAASSTAGTVRSDSSDAPWQSNPGAEMSLCGEFSVFSRQRVEEYINLQTDRSPEPATRRPPPSTPMSTCDNVPQMPTRTSIIDKEEDDDAELERVFLDGSRELAAASFKDGNYDEAIEFLQAAMSRDIKSGESSHDYRQMQVELALCYLCKGKWRLAAPLVTQLAKLKTRHDLATCNLLHALAIGYLSEYSFDDALVRCRQALQGKRKLCKSGDIEWNEYWETLGLYATIFHVTGDVIRAAVFRRELPKDFAYIHPASEVDFIRFRTELLQSTFGDDSIALGTGYAHAGIAELDGGTGDKHDDQGQQLSRRLTLSYNANLSSWRERPSQNEKYEIDTAKEVVATDSQSPNDADDETSPTSTPQESPLRRHLSRLLLGKRRRPVNSEDTSVRSPKAESPLSDPSPSTLSLARLRWFKGDNMGFPVKQPKDLLTKKPNKLAPPCRYEVQWSTPKGAFKLLRMERVTTPTPDSELSRPFGWRGETRRPYMHTRDSNQESVDSVQANAHRESFRGRHVPAVAHIADGHGERAGIPHDLNTHERRLHAETAHDCPGAKGFLLPAELADTRVSEAEVVQPRRRSRQNRGRQLRTPLRITTDFDVRDSSEFNSNLHDSFPTSLEMDAMEARVFLTNPERCSSIEERHNRSLLDGSSPPPTERKTDLGGEAEGSAYQFNVDVSKAFNQRGNPWVPVISSPRTTLPVLSSPRIPLTRISTELEKLLTRLSTIMASLSGLEDADELRAKKSMLEALVPGLKASSNDQTLVCDTERVIRSLESTVQLPQSRGADSGFESMASTGGVEANSTTLNIPTQTTSKKAGKAVLERGFSWSAGSEAAFSVTSMGRSKVAASGELSKINSVQQERKHHAQTSPSLEISSHSTDPKDCLESNRAVKFELK